MREERKRKENEQMSGIEEDAFIQTTIDTYKNEDLERILKESEKRKRQFKSYTDNDNIFILLTAWVFALIILLFILPIFVTGFITKGMTKNDQKIYWMAIFLIVAISVFKAYVF